MSSLVSSAGLVRHAAPASFVHVAHHQADRRLAWRAHVRWLADVTAASPIAKKSKGAENTKAFNGIDSGSSASDALSSLAIRSESRFNDIGVQQLSSHVFDQVFRLGSQPPSKELVQLSMNHLRRHDLLWKTTDTSEPIAFDLPELQGFTLDEHFYKLGTDCAEPYLFLAKQFVRSQLPPKPRQWIRRSGWTKYVNGKEGVPVLAPEEELLCFDTEVMWKTSPFAVMACAASPNAWYAWLSPWLLGESKSDRHLVPLGDPIQERIIVGHNVGFDRARILEEYDMKQSKNAFIDTMSLHVAVNGMCSQQRPTWMKHKKNRELRERVASQNPDNALAELLSNRSMHEEEELWVERSSINSLRDVAKFHLDVTIDKAVRDDFGELDRDGVLAKLDVLMDYCAADVAVTHGVYQIVFPNFLEVCPHPVSFAALRHLSSVILPVNRTWDKYIAKAEATYRQLSDAVQERLIDLTEKALEIKDQRDKWENDPWMKQLDWSGQEVRMVKGKRKGDPPRPAARQKKPGMPKWYRDLFVKNDAPIGITVRTRIAPLLLRMSWEGNPLTWSNKFGWTFRVAAADFVKYQGKQMSACAFDQEDAILRDDQKHAYFKLPHKDGPSARCTNPLAKGYLPYFENKTLSSEFSYAKEALEMNASCSYWISARDRIKSQMVVYEDDVLQFKVDSGYGKDKGTGPKAKTKPKADGDEDRTKSMRSEAETQGFILPQIIPMGTITRRAVENTWLTASNAKKNRVGSELKAMVRAPKGYSFVGADVDSQELWIASLVGDATFKIHGGNAVGFMTLEGTKAAGTDLHSRTASILGISRNNAKVFNYGRIYGAGLKFAATLLRQFNPGLSEKETTATATKLYANTKGTKTTRKMLSSRPFWRGGTESLVFNKLEEFAEQDRPRTPVLGAGITEALMSRFIGKDRYLTSRINWAIQSSGVDYLHLLIVSMDYLIRRFKLDARLAITVHDEIRYLVKNEDKYRAALALQVANVWTRAMFAQQAGINDLPQSCAYFSAVDIDHVLRKEVDMECVTPSHPTPIPPGESLDIKTLLNKGAEAMLDPAIVPDPRDAPKLDGIAYTPRVPVMQAMQEASGDSLAYIKAQVANDDELREIIKNTKGREPVVTTKDKSCSQESPPDDVLPYQAHAQLIPIGEPWSVAEVMTLRQHGRQRSQNRWSWDKDLGEGERDPHHGSETKVVGIVSLPTLTDMNICFAPVISGATDPYTEW